MDVQRADPELRLVALAVVLVTLVAGLLFFLALQHEPEG